MQAVNSKGQAAGPFEKVVSNEILRSHIHAVISD